MEAQQYLQTYYDQRAEQRGNHARRASGDQDVRYAEAFQRVLPQVVDGAVSVHDELARLGTATVYEAAGRKGLVDLDLHQHRPRLTRVRAGAHRPLRAGRQPDGARRDGRAANPGDVLVLTMPEPRPVALVGDLLATQAKARGVAAAARRRRRARRRGARRDGPPDLGALDPRRAAPARTSPGDDRRAGDRRRRADRGRRHWSCSMPTAPPSSPQERVGEVLEAARDREEKERVKRAKLQAGELSYDLDGLRARVEMSDLAHSRPRRAAHARSREREPRASSSTCSAWRSSRRAGQSVFLRGWGDYQRYSLKLTESDRSGLGALGLARLAAPRRSSAGGRDRGDRPRRRLGRRRPRPRARLPLPRPRRPRLRALLRDASATSRPTHLKPSLRNQPQRYTGRGAAVKRLDHVNLLATDVARLPRVRHRRARLPPLRGHRLDDGSEAGAWLSLSIAAHELIYVARRARRQRPPAPPRVLGRHPRGVPARGRHLARRTTSTSRPRRPSTRSPPGLLPLRASSRAATGSRSPPAATSSTSPTPSR